MKIWTKEEIREGLRTSAAWRNNAVVAIYAYQTADEQASGATRHSNGVGFSGCDSGILSSYAQQIKKGRTMSVKQAAIIAKKILKYSRQLAEIANMKERAKAAAEMIFDADKFDFMTEHWAAAIPEEYVAGWYASREVERGEALSA